MDVANPSSMPPLQEVVGRGALTPPRRGQAPSLQINNKGAVMLGCGPGMPGPYGGSKSCNTKKAELSLCLGFML